MQRLGTLSIYCRMIDTLIMVGVCAIGLLLLNNIMTDTDRHAEENIRNEASKRQADKERDEYWRKQRQEEEDSQWFDD